MSRRVRAQRTARLGGVELALGDSILGEVVDRERAAYLTRRAEIAPLPPVALRGTMAETPWMKSIVELCKQLDLYTYHPHLSKWSARGWPDLSILGKRVGEAFWIECKDDHKHLTEEQVKVIDRMLGVGLRVAVFRPYDGLQAVADWLTGRPAPRTRLFDLPS